MSHATTSQELPTQKANAEPYDISPWFQAAHDGDIATLQQLCDAGQVKDINVKNGGGGAVALQIAAQEGQVGVVRWLLDHGADPKVRDGGGYGTHVLEVAISAHHPKRSLQMVQMLLDHGMPVNAHSCAGNTALHRVADLLNKFGKDTQMRQGLECIANLLFEYGANTALRNDEGETAYDMLDKEKKPASMKQLGESLQQAAYSGDVEGVRSALENWAMVPPDMLFNVAASDSKNALEVARLLLGKDQNNARLDVDEEVCREVGTPLHNAARVGNEAMVKLLLQYGANPSLMNAAGQMPYELVPKGDKYALLRTSLQHDAKKAVTKASGTRVDVAQVHDVQAGARVLEPS